MWVFVWVSDTDVCQFDVEILVHRVHCPTDATTITIVLSVAIGR